MLKRIAFVLVVCAVVGVAYGAAVKIRWFDNIAEPNQDADGMAILNYVSGQDETIIQIILSDFEPNRTGFDAYTAEFVSPNQPLSPTADIETDSHGHGTLHITYAGGWSDSDIYIYVDFDDPVNKELRARGYNPG